MNIRKYKLADKAAVISLIQQELGYIDLNKQDAAQQLERITKHPDYVTFVIEEDHQIIGFCGLLFCIAYETPGTYARLIAIAIQKDKQHKGYGKHLLSYAENYAVNHHATDITLSSSLHRTSAHTFYERSGYHKKGFSFIKNFVSYLSE